MRSQRRRTAIETSGGGCSSPPQRIAWTPSTPMSAAGQVQRRLRSGLARRTESGTRHHGPPLSRPRHSNARRQSPGSQARTEVQALRRCRMSPCFDTRHLPPLSEPAATSCARVSLLLALVALASCSGTGGRERAGGRVDGGCWWPQGRRYQTRVCEGAGKRTESGAGHDQTDTPACAHASWQVETTPTKRTERIRERLTQRQRLRQRQRARDPDGPWTDACDGPRPKRARRGQRQRACAALPQVYVHVCVHAGSGEISVCTAGTVC